MKAQNLILEKILFWTPRIIVILAVLFVSMFALDSFSPNLTIGQQLLGFAIHLIPTYVLLIFLFVAWKWELIGGLLFTINSLIFSPIIFIHNFKMNHSVAISLEIILLITFPFLVAGVLFIISHFKQKKRLSFK